MLGVVHGLERHTERRSRLLRRAILQGDELECAEVRRIALAARPLERLLEKVAVPETVPDPKDLRLRGIVIWSVAFLRSGGMSRTPAPLRE